MRKLYTPLFLVLFTSCGTQVKYVGSTHPETRSVDVFVRENLVNKPYEIIGKGYLHYRMGIGNSVETIQRKAVEKAKLKGANAVVIEDYYLVDKTTSITTRTDSLKTVGLTTDINPAVSSGFTILFLRYKE
jgi:hypothetical protein